MVPLALINLSKRVESNWDLTMVKVYGFFYSSPEMQSLLLWQVCQYIDGTNHVKRIAHLADCDLDLTRQAISHLL
jgi:nitrogen permease regulator 2-like protein